MITLPSWSWAGAVGTPEGSGQDSAQMSRMPAAFGPRAVVSMWATVSQAATPGPPCSPVVLPQENAVITMSCSWTMPVWLVVGSTVTAVPFGWDRPSAGRVVVGC
jgi:hypothetical protein